MKIAAFKNKAYIDVLLILFIIAFSIAIRLPSLHIEAVPNPADRSHFMTSEGLPYLDEMDSYYYADLARGISEGTFDVQTVDIGLPLLGSVIWRIISLFKHVSLYTVLVFIGPLISSLAAIPAYCFVRRRTGRLGAFTAGMMAALNAAFLVKTGFAFYDTDILLCVLPLTMICCFVSAVESDRLWKCCSLGIVSILSFTYLTITWGWYRLYLYLVIGIWIILLLLRLLFRHNNTKRPFCIGTVLTAVYAFIARIIHGFQIHLAEAYLQSIDTPESASATTGFPSGKLFVSELGKIPLFNGNLFDVSRYGIINRLGGIIIVTVSLIALIVMITKAVKIFISLLRKDKKTVTNDDDVSESDVTDSPDNINFMITTAAFTMWSVGGGIAPVLGVRFVELTAIPLSIIVGLGIGYFGVTFKKIGLGFSSWVLVLAVLISPCTGAYSLASSQLSPVDDTLQEACAYIDDFTEKDSVIASWWDLGYYYKYETGHSVLTDGGHPDGRMHHWIGKALITDDEELSAGIFRMLVSCGTQASISADQITGSSEEGSVLIEKLLKMNEREGRKYLTDTYPDNDKEALKELADIIYPDHVPEIAVIITRDMFKKIEAISYYGLWDFSGNNLSVNSASEEMMMYRLYTGDKDAEYFKYGKAFRDPAEMCSSSVWIIPALDQ